MTSESQSKRFRHRFVAASLILAALLALALTPWAISFIDPIKTPDSCAFNSVNEVEYQRLLAQAKRQRWAVWPDLSNGLIWPSLQREVDSPSTETFGPPANEKLLTFIQELVAPEPRSAERELAAAHALMRGIRAELVNVSEVRNGRGRSDIRFGYFLPQRRFAPLCLLCWLLPHSVIDVVFERDVDTGRFALDRIELRHQKLDSSLRKETNVSNPCPALPLPRLAR